MKIIDKVEEVPNYLKNNGSYNDIVMFTKMIMKRNLSEYYFPNKMLDTEKEELKKYVTEYLESKKLFQNHYDLKKLETDEREILKERFLIDEKITLKPQGYIMFNNEFDNGIVLNYEDHLTFFNLFPGLETNLNYEDLVSKFYIISKEFKIAIHDQFGYLTSSPFYSGTGLIIESFLHLPAIVITDKFKEVVLNATEKGFITYPYFEDNRTAMGSIFVIRNKYTLKYSEEQLIESFKKFVEEIIMLEYNQRKYIIEYAKKEIEDRIWRAYGVLMYAKLLMFDEFLNLFSAYKLGLNYGIIKDTPIDFINKFIIFTQNKHLKYLNLEEDKTIEEKRAKLVKLNIGGKIV